MADKPLSRRRTRVDGKLDEPEKFGRYEIIQHLASGGMAQIYKASTANNRTFIIKKILSEYSKNDEFIKMFLEEAKISLQLKHNNIVRVIDFGQVDHSYYLAMEYVFGQDLGSLLKTSLEKRIHIPIDVACFIIMQCCRGLDYAHNLKDSFGNSVSIVHRDISPPNILVSYNGEAKILDFGIAKAVNAMQNRNTRSGVLKGKFCYMSPEQARGEPLNAQSDLFSISIVFHELLCSKSLFYTQDEIETLERVRKAKVSPPSKFRKGVSKELDQIVLKGLKPKLNARYLSCGQMADEIQAFLRKHYPRTDARSVAKVMRLMFRDDFNFRVQDARKEHWRDIFVSGGADNEILLDRALENSTSNANKPVTFPHKINWLDRLLYDPKTSQKVGRLITGFLIFAVLLGGAYGLLFTDYGKEIRQSAIWDKALEWVHLKTPQSPPPLAPEDSVSPKKVLPGSFAYWIQQADKLEAQGNLASAEEALVKALRINSFETGVEVRLNFLRLQMGQTKQPCKWFNEKQDLAEADSLLAEAICQEATGDRRKALINYGDFIRKFPKDSRADKVQLVVKNLLKRKD